MTFALRVALPRPRPIRPSPLAPSTRQLALRARAPSRRPLFLGVGISLLATGWAVDRYVYAEAVGRTVRLAYNA